MVPIASQREKGAEKASKRVPLRGPGEGQNRTFFELWAVLGPKCLQELSQEPPEPLQASVFHAFSQDLGRFWTDFELFLDNVKAEEQKRETKKRPAFRFVFKVFLVRTSEAQYRILNDLVSVMSRLLVCRSADLLVS